MASVSLRSAYIAEKNGLHAPMSQNIVKSGLQINDLSHVFNWLRLLL